MLMNNRMPLPTRLQTDRLPELKKHPDQPTAHPVLFFDIDGTMLSTQAGRRAISDAFQELFGVEEAFTDISFAGQTDPLIVRRVFIENSVEPTPQNFEKLYQLYYSNLYREIQTDLKLINGIDTLLEKLQALPLHLGIITGNNFIGAQIKLGVAGLHSFFEGGAFGEDGPQRTKIARAGLDKFNADPARCLMIGDSVHDIRVGRENGMLTLALPTGVTPRENLEKENPDYLFDNLDEEKLFAVLENNNFLN
ncbi:MAG: HAD family hydrolase [bacterium]